MVAAKDRCSNVSPLWSQHRKNFLVRMSEILVPFSSLQIPLPLEGRQNALGIVVAKGCRTAHMFANCPNGCWTSVFQETHPWLSRTSDFSRTIKPGQLRRNSACAKGASREILAMCARNFCQIDPKNDAHFLNLLQMSKFWPPPLDKIGVKIAVNPELLQWADLPPPPSIVLCCGAAQGRIIAVV